MKFHLTQSYIKQQAMRTIYGTAMVTVIFLGMAIYAYYESYMTGIYMSAGFFALTLIRTSFAWKVRRSWIDNGDSMEVEVTATGMIQRKEDKEYIIPEEAITSVLIKVNRKGVKSLSFRFTNGGTGKLEGYENMEQLSLEIEKFVDPNKIQRRSYLHR